MKSKTGFSFILLGCCTLLYGCGGSSDDPATPSEPVVVEPTVLTGVLGAGAIRNVTFNTDTQTGTTNAAGEFQYLEEESVVFSIGDLALPSVTATPLITLRDLGAGSADPDTTAGNITRLLQSLDADGYAYNGIEIPGAAAASSAPVNFAVSATNFELNPIVTNMVANSGSLNNSLVPLQDASILLNQITTLEEFEDEIVGNQLVLRRAGGTRVPTTQFVFQSDGTLVRFIDDNVVDRSADLNWSTDGQFFCTVGTVGNEQRPLDCQVASLIANNIVALVPQRGAGTVSNFFIE